ncbi:MAG: alpha/beta hydrolase [Chloroflexota bacterium]
MATLVTEQGIVHYESYGRGRPVLLLHGWLGSWALWRQSIEVLGGEFRTYALDFFGFGESTDRAEDFTVNNFVLLVHQFMDRLGIVKAPLVGHSMGGTVSLGTATRFPERVVKVVVIGSPIQGTSLNILLKASGNQNFANLIWQFPNLIKLFLRGYAYFMANDGRAMSAMISDDISRVTVNSFFQSIRTLRETDVREDIVNLQMPVMGMYGKKDIIVSPNQAQLLSDCIPHAKIDWYTDAGHFIMLDQPDRFHSSVIDFLNNG